jgi:hypothetical protein
MKTKRSLFVAAAIAAFAVVDAFPLHAQTADPARQLQQLQPINALPGKGKRWALVIGVDKYADPQISPLKGADNDARLMSDALVRYAGFPQDQVILLSTDQPGERQPTRANILRRLSNLSSAVPKDGLLLISFSGHGMERSSQAFLLPSDAQISDQISFLSETAINVNRIKDQIKEIGVSQVIVMLDACRNDPGGRADAPNPLSNAYTNAFNFDVRNQEVQAFATLYATGIGQRAYEYTEKKQGYFSWAVVEALKGAAANDKGEVTLSQLIKYVQEAVPKRITIDLGSTKQQRPFAVIEGFRAEELVVSATNGTYNAAGANIPTATAVDPAAIELSFWDSIKSSTNPDDFKAYLDKYPDGQFAALAKLRAQPARPSSSSDSGSLEMAYWNAIKDSKSSGDFKAYVTKFPNGVFTDLAKSRASALEADERERAAIKELAVDDTTWLGYMKNSKETAPGLLGTPITVEFLKGGIFTATYNTVVTVPGFLINDYKTETVKMAGTWRQEGDLISVQVSQPAAEVLRLSVAANKLQGGSVQGTYNLDVKKVLSKPMSSQPCDFRGFSMTISYRQKDKIDRLEDANKLATRLRGYGMEVEVEKLNNKDAGTIFSYYNGQANIANSISECVKDAFQIKLVDGGKSFSANQFRILLQQ